MKTADKLEVIEEMLGSLPEAPEGKELVGVKFKKPKLGEKFLCKHMQSWIVEGNCVLAGISCMIATISAPRHVGATHPSHLTRRRTSS
jgi:hypothetical protein